MSARHPTAAEQSVPPDPGRVAERYEVLGRLGRGGMATVYRVRDLNTGDEVALKRLHGANSGGPLAELFEQEFHALTQLTHPRIVCAYDYGFDQGLPFYTMELVDGGDLREAAPLPWQEVCAVAHDVCSALSLLHSRRLVHLDLTPRNIRRTADGKAKLIDFGAMASFGVRALVVGTPPCVPPEVAQQLSLDGRSDLFSLGATLYRTLTGRFPFYARSFDALPDAWRSVPVSPRNLVPDVPPALDQLVMALLRLDIGSRPRSAAEVMDRLSPMLSSTPDEGLVVAGAHLTAPREVARDAMRVRMRKQVVRAVRGRGGGFLIAGAPGTGRSRALDIFILEAKLNGVIVARADGSDGAFGPFGVARALVEQVHHAAPLVSQEIGAGDPRVRRVLYGDNPESRPQLLDVGRPGLEGAQVQEALHRWFNEITDSLPLALAVDDLELIDEPSAALLTALSIDAPKQCLTYAISARHETLDARGSTLAILRRHARKVSLEPLTEAQLAALLAGVFGEVPNLESLGGQLHELSGGRPRECMQLAQHLVDKGVIGYCAGAFSLPAAIDPEVMAGGLEGALVAQIEGLSPASKRVGRLLSLAGSRRLTRAQLLSMEELSGVEIDEAVAGLRSVQAVTGKSHAYRVCHPSIARMLLDRVDDGELRGMHDQLAATTRSQGAGLVAVAYHALRGADAPGALAVLVNGAASIEERTGLVNIGIEEIGVDRTTATYRFAYDVALAKDSSQYEQFKLWGTIAAIAALGGDGANYDLTAAVWLSHLKRASGEVDWRALSDELEPADRAMQAFIKASERHGALPEGEWTPAPTDAIKELVAYVAISIAVAARTLRAELSKGLAGLLLPFVPLSPVVNVMRLNAEAAFALSMGQREKGRARSIALITAIDAVEGTEPTFMARVRAAVCQSIATQEAALGIYKEDPDQWLQDADASQRVGAENVRKIMALHRGDWAAAQGHRREAELIALQHDASVMFITLGDELEAHALARDLTGIRNVRARIIDLARRVPVWGGLVQLANVHLHYLCGELNAAVELADQIRDAPANAGLIQRGLLTSAEGVLAEVHLERGEGGAALAVSTLALDRAQACGHRHVARNLSLIVGLAEARSGAHAPAVARIEGVIEEQQALGVRGLLRGRAYEYLARCAMEANDREAFEGASQSAVEHYRPGSSDVLGALYERLLEDAGRSGLIGEGSLSRGLVGDQSTEADNREVTIMLGRRGQREEVRAALALLGQATQGSVIHLYLLTDTGLSLSASTGVESQGSQLLLEFARAQLELERNDDSCTVIESAGQQVDQNTKICVQDDEGRTLFAVPLMARYRGSTELAGIVLVDREVVDEEAVATVRSVARRLLASGACQSVTVA